jgi:methionyl-tRNA synthetase
VLPWQVSSTEFILFDGQKFSKSKKIGVWIDEALNVAPGEYWRYVLMAMRPESRDANFTWHDFEVHVNSELNDVLGNFVHRTLSFINNNFESRVPIPSEFDETDRALQSQMIKASSDVTSSFDNFQLKDALATILELARIGNQYLSSHEPWHLIKTDRQKTATTLFLASQLVRTLAVLISPFLPDTAGQICNQINSEVERWSEAGNLTLEPGHAISKSKPLFHKISAPK